MLNSFEFIQQCKTFIFQMTNDLCLGSEEPATDKTKEIIQYTT